MITTADKRTDDYVAREDNRSKRPRKGSLGWWLDSSIPLPGGFRIGLDGIIGLIPGVGDAIGGGLSTWILYQGYKRGVPNLVMARMMLNVLFDALLGTIPLLGDVFDFFFKANAMNMRLLADYEVDPNKTYKRSALATFGFIVALVAIAAIFIYGVIMVFTLLWRAAMNS